MKELFRDKEHLVRVTVLFVAGFLVFLVVRALMVPEGFGTYGHYREGALKDNMDKPLVFAGRAACETCHSDVVEVRKGSGHEGIGCESCHGPQAAHANADDPAKAKPKKPDPRTLCLVCHQENVAKPAKFPQVDPKGHLKDVGGEGKTCSGCHRPHHPEFSSELTAPAQAAGPSAGSEVQP